MSATELDVDSVNERINNFVSGLPFTLIGTRLILLIVHLLEQIQDQGRDAEVILADFIRKHEESRGDPDENEDPPDLGPCCACEKIGPTVRNIIMLDKRAPEPGSGWGCCQCGLPMDGAVFVICDECFEAKREPKFACHGYPKNGVRIPIAMLTEPFEHDMSKHPEAQYG